MLSPKNTFFSALIVVWAIVYCFAPLHSDILVNFGAAFQADHFGTFPSNVYHAWDLRGIGNKLLYYSIKEVAVTVTSPENTVVFGAISKVVYLLFFFGLSFLSLNSLKPILIRYNLSEKALKLGLVVTTLSAPTFFMQAELTAIPITLGMFALAYSDKRILNYLSGAMLIVLFSLKGITILYAAFILLALLYTAPHHPKLLYRAIVSGAMFTGLGVLIYLYVIPLELLDLKNATLYQDSFSRTLHHFIGRIAIRTPEYYIYAMFHIPILMTGLFLGLTQFKRILKGSFTPTLNGVFIMAFIGIPYLYVFIQNKFFNYHYTAFAIPCIVLISQTQYSRKLLGTLLIGLVTTNVSLHAFNHESLFFQYQRQKAIVQDGIVVKREVSEAEPVLYLYDGTINFIVTNKSYLREFYPLPIQRSQSYWRVKESPQYIDTIKKVAAFDGPYIVIKTLWFRPELHGLSDKLENEYEPVDIPTSPLTTVYKRKG